MLMLNKLKAYIAMQADLLEFGILRKQIIMFKWCNWDEFVCEDVYSTWNDRPSIKLVIFILMKRKKNN